MRILNILGVTEAHVKHVASTDSYRPAMTGVYFDLLNSCMVATNSHLLVVFPIEIEWSEGEIGAPDDVKNGILKSQSKIVPIEFFNKNKYMGNVKNYPFEPTFDLSDPDFARVMNGMQEVFKCPYIDAVYPNYESVFPQGKEKLESIGMNSQMLNAIFKSVPFTPKNLKFSFYGGNRAIWFENNAHNFKGLLMPVIDL